MENERLRRLVKAEDAFVDLFRKVLALGGAGQVESFSVCVGANFYLGFGVLITQLFLEELFGRIFRQQFVNMPSVEGMVFSAALPPDDVVRLVLLVVELDHKLEFEFLVGAELLDFRVRNFSDPEMTRSPFHLHSAATSVLVRVPAAEEVGRAKQPKILAERCFILDSEYELLELNLIGIEHGRGTLLSCAAESHVVIPWTVQGLHRVRRFDLLRHVGFYGLGLGSVVHHVGWLRRSLIKNAITV